MIQLVSNHGSELYPTAETNMVADARVVFSQTVKKFKEKPELGPKLKPLYAYFHSYEAKFGELAQIKELEKQMAESFPEDPHLSHFAARFSSERFNPIAARVIISPATQMRPKHIVQSVEHVPASARASPHPSVLADRSPRPQFLQAVNSPKRPFQADDSDDLNPPRKVARGASPLKGAAGRRLDQQRRAAQGQGVPAYSTPAPISRDITFLLGLIPPAHQYAAARYRPDGLVRMLRETVVVPDFNDWKVTNQGSRHNRQVSTDFPAYALPAGGRNSPFMRGGVGVSPAPTLGEANVAYDSNAAILSGPNPNPPNFYAGAYPYNLGQHQAMPQYPPFRQG
jgi:cleavage stimulation factor subunit 3